jgi:hypothetical protein
VLCDRLYDRRHGVSTCGAIPLEDLDIDSESVACGNLYDAFPRRSLLRLIRRVPEADLSEFTFVDYGSGKGKVLLVAAEHPFRMVVGVEFSPALHREAVANIDRFRSGRTHCAVIHSEMVDATCYEFPEGDCVLFFFAPFGGEVLEKTLGNIDDSLQANPRKVYLIFATDPETHPLPCEALDGMLCLKRIDGGRLPFEIGRRYPLEFVILSSDPTSAANH